eukprot:5414418-Pyramimonas_sp.AAC.1
MQNQTGKYKLDALYVHVSPPSVEELEKRIRSRLIEDQSIIDQRIAFATAEVGPLCSPSTPSQPPWTFVPLAYCTSHPKDAPGMIHC